MADIVQEGVLETSPALGLDLGLGFVESYVLFDGDDVYGFTAFVFTAHKIIASSYLWNI